jgi:hypothetical protein
MANNPGRYDVKIYQGNDFTFQAQLQYAAGIPADIDEWAFLAQIRAGMADYAPVVDQFETDVDPEADVVTLSLTAEQTALLPVGRLNYDLQVQQEDGRWQTWLKGLVMVSREVSRLGVPE